MWRLFFCKKFVKKLKFQPVSLPYIWKRFLNIFTNIYKKVAFWDVIWKGKKSYSSSVDNLMTV